MINNPKEIEEILKELEEITFEELDEAIKIVDKEYGEVDINSEYIYEIENNQENYNMDDYYDFCLHNEKTSNIKKRLNNKDNKSLLEAA